MIAPQRGPHFQSDAYTNPTFFMARAWLKIPWRLHTPLHLLDSLERAQHERVALLLTSDLHAKKSEVPFILHRAS